MIINKLIRFTLYTFLIFSLYAVSAFGQTQMTVELENDQINAQSDYRLSFQTTVGQYFKIFQGQMVITLPSGFSTEALDSVEIIDEFKHLNYVVERIETEDNSIRLYLKLKWVWSLSSLESAYPSNPDHKINLQVILSKIQNPPQSGDYQITLVGLSSKEKVVIGPLLSDPFEITSASIHSIVVTPSEDIKIKAGTVQPFSATAYDVEGNMVDGVVFEWNLFECTNCIGQFTDSLLFATRVGESIAQASADGVSGFSGKIIVTPGDLFRMTLQIDETQFVGNIINHNAGIILYDAHNNLKTDYDLAENPIELVVSSGELNRYILDINEYQIGGVVRINDFEIIYSGLSGVVSLTAETDLIASNIVDVNFNNYDILDVIDSSGQTVDTVYVGDTTPVTILVQNNGNLQESFLHLEFYWISNSIPIRMSFYSLDPPPVGEVRRLDVNLPPLTNAGSSYELFVSVQATYSSKSTDSILSPEISTYSIRHFPVEVVEKIGPPKVILNVESIKPDTIHNKTPFELSFDVITENFNQPIDSTSLKVTLLDINNVQIIDEIYNGNPDYLSFDNVIISYGNIEAILETDLAVVNGWYPIVFEYQLFSEGEQFPLSEQVIDSIYVVFDNGISLVEGSLSPKIVYAGTNVSFRFKVNLESTVAYDFHGIGSQFRVYDESFSTSTNLFLETDSLYPGENLLRSATISIQPEQVGSELLAEANFSFCFPGLSDTITFVTNFTQASLPIQVFELPTVQILDLEVLSPNSPIVNSSQEIQFRATIVNHSNSMLDSVQLELQTIDGLSTIVNPLVSVKNIQAYDTVTVLFDVVTTANAQSLPESFRVDFTDNSLGTITPVNNFAYLLIEDEALLDISYRVNGHENISNLVLIQGEQLHVQIEVDNNGTADVFGGSYQFIVSGLTSTSPDTFTGALDIKSSIDFNFAAPLFDTVMQFAFSVIEIPIDVNYDAPAKLNNDSFNFSVISVSNNAELLFEPIYPNTNLALPGRSKDLFELIITNNNNSSLNSIQIDFIDLGIFTISHDSIDAKNVINFANTSFMENGQMISTSTVGGNKIMFSFPDFIIAPQQTKTIQLVADFNKSSHKGILLEILQSSVRAIYSDGPSKGQEVNVKSINGSDKIVEYSVVFKGSSLEESFTIEKNPFNPNLESVQFAFELTEEAMIEFQLFTLTGEEVYRRIYQAGSIGASVGENIIKWDGCNNSGDMVLNGIYIASIINKKTGEYSRIKVAVVK